MAEEKTKPEFEFVRYSDSQNMKVFVNRIRYRSAHFHPAFEISVCLEGSTNFNISGQDYHLEPGDLLIINPNSLHEIESRNDSSLFIFIQFPGTLFQFAHANMVDLYFEYPVLSHTSESTRSIYAIAVEFSYLSFFDESEEGFYRTGLFFFLLDKLLRETDHRFLSESEQYKAQKEIKRINRFLNFVEQNYMYNIKLSDFAKSEHLSLSYVSRLVKKSINKTFQEYVKDVRSDHALKLMDYGHQSLTSIALESGFSNVHYMKQAIMERYGETPGELLSDRKDEKPGFVQYGVATTEKIYSRSESQEIVKTYRPGREELIDACFA